MLSRYGRLETDTPSVYDFSSERKYLNAGERRLYPPLIIRPQDGREVFSAVPRDDPPVNNKRRNLRCGAQPGVRFVREKERARKQKTEKEKERKPIRTRSG